MLNYLEVCRTWFVDWNKNEFGHVGKTIEKLHLNIGLSYTEPLLILLRTFKHKSWFKLVCNLVHIYSTIKNNYNYTYEDQKVQQPRPTQNSKLYSSTFTQINKFVKEGIKQQERALPEDGNKEERLNIMEYMSKCLSTSLSKEANVVQKITLFTLFSQCSSCYFFLSDTFRLSLSLRTLFLLYTPPYFTS